LLMFLLLLCCFVLWCWGLNPGPCTNCKFKGERIC
jgi:hypothetical protein